MKKNKENETLLVYDIHNSEQRLKSQLKNTEELPEPNRSLLLDFISRYGTKKQLSPLRKAKLLSSLSLVAKTTKKPLNKLDYKTIEDFVIKKQEEGCEAWTIHSYISIIKTWLKYLDEKKYFDTIKKLNELKPRKFNKISFEDLITPQEQAKIMRACDVQEACLMILMYSGALTIGETANARIDAVKWDEDREGFNFIVRKGKVESRKREVPISDELAVNSVKAWLEKHPQINDVTAPLFVNEYGNPFTYNSLVKHKKKILSRAGIKRKLNFHRARHTRLTQLYAELPSQVVKRFAGHAPSSRMEEVYDSLNPLTVKQKIDELNGKKKYKERKALQERKRYCLKCNKAFPIESAPAFCSCGFPLQPAIIESKDKKIENLELEIKAIKELMQEIIESKN